MVAPESYYEETSDKPNLLGILQNNLNSSWVSKFKKHHEKQRNCPRLKTTKKAWPLT